VVDPFEYDVPITCYGVPLFPGFGVLWYVRMVQTSDSISCEYALSFKLWG